MWGGVGVKPCLDVLWMVHILVEQASVEDAHRVYNPIEIGCVSCALSCSICPSILASKVAEGAVKALFQRRSADLGLLGKHIDSKTGTWTETSSGIG